MTSESIQRIAARAAAQLANRPDDDVLRDCIVAMAEDIATTVFLAAQTEVERAAADPPSPEECAALKDRLDLHAANVGIDLAIKVRASVFPEGHEAPVTEIELIAARAYWRHLERLVTTANRGGSA